MSTTPPHPPDFRLATFFPYRVRTFYRDVSLSVQAVYAPAHGLTPAEWRTMAVLAEHEPMSATQIVARSSMDKVNVSRAVAGLEKAGLLARHVDPADRRRALLRLTPRGRAVLADLVPRVLAVERQLLDGLTDTECDTLVRLMQRVRDNAAALREDAAAAPDRERLPAQ